MHLRATNTKHHVSRSDTEFLRLQATDYECNKRALRLEGFHMLIIGDNYASYFKVVVHHQSAGTAASGTIWPDKKQCRVGFFPTTAANQTAGYDIVRPAPWLEMGTQHQ